MPYCDPSHRLHAIMAGSGNPYSVLSKLRLRILRALHDTSSIEDLATIVGLERDEVSAELAPLREAQLIAEVDGNPRPNFLIATSRETHMVDSHAAGVGQQLAKRLLELEPAITGAFEQLTVGRETTLRDLSFLLIGDRILDVGLLDALSRERTLMPSAPARPSPIDPDARYYCWMIEGDHDQLGRYGQRMTTLPWDDWHLITFGQYTVGDNPNSDRDRIESAARAYLLGDIARTPADVARLLKIPVVGAADAGRWWTFARGIADELLTIYWDAQQPIRQLYASLRASHYLKDGFGEFFCWYDHLAYAHAIDVLALEGVLTIPDHRFAAAVWQEVPQATAF